MMFYPLFSAEIPAPSGLSLLKEGTVAVKGLPFFGANRIPALFGRYESAEGYSVSVWAVNEALFFDSEKWTVETRGAMQIRSCMTGEKNRVWMVKKEILMRQESSSASDWYFAAEFSGDIPDSYCTAFYGAFVARTEFFFSSARRYSDLSFPAAVSAAGN